MGNFDYKEDIVQSRVGHLGSSDAKILKQVADIGFVPSPAYKRLAVCKGLIEHQDIPRTAAIVTGDIVEAELYEMLHDTDSRWESNPCWISKKYARKNFSLLSHPDIVRKDDERKVLTIVEVKTTKFSFEKTRDTYANQLYIHWLIGNEKVKEFGNGWTVKLQLAVYNTEGLDLENGIEFNPERLTVRDVRMGMATVFDVGKACDIIDEFLETFNEYYEDEVDGNLLPEKVKAEFDQVTTFLTEINEREKKVEDFKKKLTEFMISKGIKGIKTDAWAITLVNESESVSVDYKSIFANEIEAKKPRVANKLKKQYKKVTKKKAYIMIKTKDNNND